jgi:ABC-type nitrate/sulfonate/bicarbonate transport system permease component
MQRLAKPLRKPTRVILPLVLLVAAWAVVAGFRLVDPIVLPAPWSVLRAASGMVRDRILGDVALTLARVFGALVFAAAVGIPVGLYLGYRKRWYQMVEGPLHALRSIPASALFPLFLIIVGVGETSIVALAAYPSLLVILVNTVTGATLANKRRLYQAKLFELSSFETITEIVFYEALPNIFDGVRTAASYSMVLVIAVEMFVGLGERGLGRAIYEYQATYRIPEAYAAVMVAGAIGILLNVVVNMLQTRMLRWLPNAHE